MNSIYRSNLYAEWLVLIYILGSLTLSILYTILGVLPPRWLRSILQYGLLFGLPSYLFMRRFGLTFKGSLRLVRPSGPLPVLCTILFALCMQPPLMVLSSLSETLFYNHVAASMETALSYPFPLVLLGSAVFPAFFEEWACRGIFLSGYRRAHPLLASLLCGIFFGILHMNMQQFIYAVFFGFGISWLCLVTDCLWLPMLAHLIINTCQLTAAYWGYAIFPSETAVFIAGLCCLPILYLLLRAMGSLGKAPYDSLKGQMKPFLLTIVIFVIALLLL